MMKLYDIRFDTGLQSHTEDGKHDFENVVKRKRRPGVNAINQTIDSSFTSSLIKITMTLQQRSIWSTIFIKIRLQTIMRKVTFYICNVLLTNWVLLCTPIRKKQIHSNLAV